jgi:hypothetical protein
VSDLAAARVSAAIFVSMIAFIVIAGYPKEQSDFSRSFFMTHKAFFIAILYGIVIMSGTSGVAGAVRTLLYRRLSSKVFMYIGTIAGFLAFTIFLGYFPDFRKGNTDEHREVAQKHPRFVEVLFEYIMIPIMLALTIVLMAWAGKTVMTGMGSSFVRLSSIASSFAFGGIWLHIMVTHYKTGLASFYRKVYPLAALIILAFEAWALVTQLQKSGLKITEYIFIMIWVVAFGSALLLIFLKERAHFAIAALTCVIAVISVMPFVGYRPMTVSAQVSRLEKLLSRQGMLSGEKISPAASEPDRNARESITDAVSYLANVQDAKLPPWFDRNLRESDVFMSKFGFAQTWPEPESIYQPGENMGTAIHLSAQSIDISGYRWALNFDEGYGKGVNSVVLKGDKGSYDIYWNINLPGGIPSLKILLDGRVILEQNLNSYVDRITGKYPPGKTNSSEATLDDMSIVLETQEVKVMLVFRNIEISIDPQQDNINYWFSLESLYMKEMP